MLLSWPGAECSRLLQDCVSCEKHSKATSLADPSPIGAAAMRHLLHQVPPYTASHMLMLHGNPSLPC